MADTFHQGSSTNYVEFDTSTGFKVVQGGTTRLVVDDGGVTLTGSATQVTSAAGQTYVVDMSAAASGESDYVLRDNLADAMSIREGANDYLHFRTTNGGELVRIGQRLSFTAATELTIASGTVARTQVVHTIDTESDAASDDLDTVTGGGAEQILLIRPASAARTVVVKHSIGANGFACPGGQDISLAEGTDWLLAAHDGTQWVVLAFNTLARPVAVDLIFKAATTLTIASGAITATQGSHIVDTEGAAASDDLDTMAGGTAEETVLLRPASGARTVVIKHSIGANGFACPSGRDISLADANDWALCAYNGTQWTVLAFNTLAKGGGGLGSALASTSAGLGASLVGLEAIAGVSATELQGFAEEIAPELLSLTAARDKFAIATIAVADTGGGGTDAGLTVSLVQAETGVDVGSARQVLIWCSATSALQYLFGSGEASVTFGTATTGSIIASGNGWCLAQTDTAGDFACTASNTDDETVYFKVITPFGVSDTTKACCVIASNVDTAAWSA